MKTGGRREGEQISLPCLGPFAQRPSERKREEGRDIFEFVVFFAIVPSAAEQNTYYSRQFVHLIQTLSPKLSDSQSVRSELSVRRDGLFGFLFANSCLNIWKVRLFYLSLHPKTIC